MLFLLISLTSSFFGEISRVLSPVFNVEKGSEDLFNIEILC